MPPEADSAMSRKPERELISQISLTTSRLLLRPWCLEDREPFRSLNADAEVMKYFPGILSSKESDGLANRIEAHFPDYGFGLWAVELPGIAPFIGYIGLSVPGFDAGFTPCVEIGWRLARSYWGNGFATEGAREVLRFGFGQLGLREIVSFTVPTNLRSRRVMERLGMNRSPADDFDHPSLPEGHPLRRHVLYRLTTADFFGTR